MVDLPITSYLVLPPSNSAYRCSAASSSIFFRCSRVRDLLSAFRLAAPMSYMLTVATARMRELTGRGMFDLDFDANGQMVWKLSPDAGRAQLAEMAGRGG